eukprot:TRINITY_DN27810_c0_g3_i2.p1 TRINITY_DN27810_c0_g3~~TRINITY_DN27810_c0_g3_i2.p1  ORF type:complete len:1527 (+),score=477.80 TRINITY_DN27810_c0_g3_i2:119-4699(+)
MGGKGRKGGDRGDREENWRSTGDSAPAENYSRPSTSKGGGREEHWRSSGDGSNSKGGREDNWRSSGDGSNSKGGKEEKENWRSPGEGSNSKGSKGGKEGGCAGPAPVKRPEDLPIYAHREDILRHIDEHRVTHIQGETGCGKSTQVPKYILEHAEERRKRGLDGDTKIVVTQPRRMAAITLARRVASELHEDIGKTVGYKISGDSVSGKLCFATTGFLLQVLVNQPEELGSYSHVILDEVHERSVDADLLTMLMKLLLQCYPKVKLIVMSATLQAKLFAEYFGSLEQTLGWRPPGRGRPGVDLTVKPIFVGVRTYPVEDIYLDELDDQFKIEGSLARRGLDKAMRGFQGMGGRKGKGKGKGKDSKGGGGGGGGFIRLEPQIAEGLDELCKELIVQMAREMCTVIVFLPGIADITSFYEALAPLDGSRAERRGYMSNNWRDNGASPDNGVASGDVTLRIYAMHSLIPREEQEEVFNEPAKGVCHVVLASNIAESSLTLPSVCGIIDLAMRRSIQYDARRLMSCLVTTWCSQSSCRQRSGRAGRTMPGRAIRLVTRDFFDKHMVEFDPPEMLNAPLTKLYLQAKQLCQKLDNLWDEGVIPEGLGMDLSTPTKLLGEVVQPPSTALVSAAITELADVGCIDRPAEDAQITPLGYIAMALPCELRLCRLIYFGLMLKCEADAIAMVAGLTAADPFSTPSLLVLKDEKEYVKKLERSFTARRKFDRSRYSEPLMLRDLFAEWIQAGAPRGPRAMGGFARDYNVIPKKFEAMVTEAVDLCTRIVKLLDPRSNGFKALQKLLSTMRFTVDRREELVKAQYPENRDYYSIFSEDVTMLRALLCAGFSDQMLLGLNPRWYPSGGGGGKQKKKKEELMADTIYKQEMDPTGTVVFMNPPPQLRGRGLDFEDNHAALCEALCGERPKRIHWEEKERLLYCDFVGPSKQAKRKKGKKAADVLEEWNEEWDPEAGPPILRDVCPQAHLVHQFGAGRWKFTIECPVDLSTATSSSSMWQPGDDGQWEDENDEWENNGGWEQSGWDQSGWQGGYGEEAQTNGTNGAKADTGPTTLEVLKPLQPYLVNWEVLQMASSDPGGGGKGGGKKGGSKKAGSVKAMLDWRNPLGYACHVVQTGYPEELLGICASVQGLESGGSAFVAGATVLGMNHFPLLLSTMDPRKWAVQWGFDTNGEVKAVKVSSHELILPLGTLTPEVLNKVNEVRSKVLESLTPYEEDEEERYKRGKGRRPHYIWVSDITEEMSALLEEIWDTPEVVQDYPKKLQWCSAEGEEQQRGEEQLRCFQPIAEEYWYDPTQWQGGGGGASSSSASKASKKKAGGGWEKQPVPDQRQGINKQDLQKVQQIVAQLKKVPNNELTLSKLCGTYYTSRKVLEVYPDFFQFSHLKGANEMMVRLANGSGGGGGQASGGSSKKAKGGSKGSSSRQAKPSPYGRSGGGNIEAFISKLCGRQDVQAQVADFDRIVKNWIRDFERRRGTRHLEEAFEHLAEWTSKRPRDQVKKWNAYIMVLLRNWEVERWERADD